MENVEESDRDIFWLNTRTDMKKKKMKKKAHYLQRKVSASLNWAYYPQQEGTRMSHLSP